MTVPRATIRVIAKDSAADHGAWRNRSLPDRRSFARLDAVFAGDLR